MGRREHSWTETIGFIAVVAATIGVFLAALPASAVDLENCTPIALATWGQPLPGRQTVAPGATACFSVTAPADGGYVVRSSEPATNGSDLTTIVRDPDDFPLYADNDYWELQDFYLYEGSTYRVEVTNNGAQPRSAGVGVFRSVDGTGCEPFAAGTGWPDAGATGVAFAEPDVVHCHELTTPGELNDHRENWLVRDDTASVQVLVKRWDGVGACGMGSSAGTIEVFPPDGRYVCDLWSGEDFRLLTYNQVKFGTGSTASSAEFFLHRLAAAADDSCVTDIDGTVAPSAPLGEFSLAASPTTLTAVSGRRCHTSRIEQGSKVWVQLADPSVSWWLVDADGMNQRGRFEMVAGSFRRTQCTAALPCTLVGEPPYRLLVEGAAGAEYAAGIRRLSQPVGCLPLGSIADGISPQSGVLLAGESQCYRFIGGTGDQIAPIAQDPGDASRYLISVYDAAGDLVGQTPTSGIDRTLTLATDGEHTLVVEVGSFVPGPYSLTGSCLTQPCGPFVLERVENGSVGAGEVTLRLRGQGLAPGTVITATQGVVTLAGTIVGTSEDDRTLDAAIDFSGQSGTWDIVATASGGRIRTLTDALSIRITAWPAALRTEVSGPVNGFGQTVFVPGRTHRFTVTMTNVGDFDGRGCPVLLGELPLGSTVEPLFAMRTLDDDGNVIPYAFGRDTFVHDGESESGAAFIVNRLGPGVTETLDFLVTTPLDSEEFTLAASSGACLLGEGATSTLTARSFATAAVASASSSAAACVYAIRDALASTLPGADCVDLLQVVPEAWANDLAVLSGEASFSPAVLFDRMVDIQSSGTGCAADVGGAALKTLGEILDLISKGSDAVEGLSDILENCFPDEEEDDDPEIGEPGEEPGNPFAVPPDGWRPPYGGRRLPVGPVSSIDPNAVVGPQGDGPERAYRGEGIHRYSVFFENDPEATAPAQEVRISSQLDPEVYDLSTLRFLGVSFGLTTIEPPPAASWDELVDLNTPDLLRLRIQASVSPEGDLEVYLGSVDPITGGLPDNPLLGFLPPNVDGFEGQGVVHYEVALLNVATGTAVTNVADIVFDLNDPITTNTWSNLVDTDLPTAQVTAPASATGDFEVTWSATDATSGVARMDVFVAVNGGPYTLWRDDVEPGSDEFDATPGHTYSFGAVAWDWAHNRSETDPPYGPSTVVAATGSTSEESGVIPPDKATLSCAGKAAANLSKLGTALTKCHVKAATATFKAKSFDLAACESKAITAYDAKVLAIKKCPACVPANATDVRNALHTFLAARNGDLFCSGTTPFGGGITGFVPPDKDGLGCAAKLTTAGAKLAGAIIKCHVKAAGTVIKGKPFAVQACENAAAAKYDKTVSGVKKCPACTVSAAPVVREAIEALHDGLNGDVYCEGITPFPD